MLPWTLWRLLALAFPPSADVAVELWSFHPCSQDRLWDVASVATFLTAAESVERH